MKGDLRCGEKSTCGFTEDLVIGVRDVVFILNQYCVFRNLRLKKVNELESNSVYNLGKSLQDNRGQGLSFTKL